MNDKALLLRLRKALAEASTELDEDTATYWRRFLNLEERSKSDEPV